MIFLKEGGRKLAQEKLSVREGPKQGKLVLFVVRLPVLEVAEEWVIWIGEEQVDDCATSIWVVFGNYPHDTIKWVGWCLGSGPVKIV